jgi:hypothetical protein
MADDDIDRDQPAQAAAAEPEPQPVEDDASGAGLSEPPAAEPSPSAEDEAAPGRRPRAQAEKDETTGRQPPPKTGAEGVQDLLGRPAPAQKADDGGDQPLDDFRLAKDDTPARRHSGDRFSTSVRTNLGTVQSGANSVSVQVVLPGGEEINLLRYELTDDDLTRLRRLYVRGGTFRAALRILRAERVVVLRGPEGSGRTAAAQALLERLKNEPESDSPIDRIGGLVLRDGVSVSDVARQPEAFPDRWGMVLESRDGVELAMGDRVRAYRDFAARANGYVVLVGPPAGEEDTSQFACAHDWPEPADVLKRYLVEELPDSFSGERLTQILEDPAVTNHLAQHRRPGQVVRLAAALVDGVRRGRPVETIVVTLEPDWRDVARRALEDALTATDDAFGAPRRQALRTAYAIFDGLELNDVFSAAEELLGMLRRVQAPDSTPARPVFGDGLDKLLFKEMLGEGDIDQGQPTTARRALLRNPQLSDAFLDVAWNNYDTTRFVLLHWLDWVATHGRPATRLRAAQAAGKLALYDFEKVMADLIRPWALHPNGLRRQAAAWALEQVSRNDWYASRVRQRVHDWVLSNDGELHDTAAKVYGTTFGSELPDIAMADLRTIATDPRQLRFRSVGHAVANLYLADPAGPVLDHLDAWLDDASPEVAAHTAWALLFLARILHNERPEWPQLLLDADNAPARRPVLARLWRAALSGSTTTFLAWDLLRQWLELPYRNGNDDGDVPEALLQLLTETLDSSVLRRRGLWHVKLWLRRRPDDQLLKKLSDRLEERPNS